MKIKSLLTVILTLVGLVAAMVIGYALGHLLPVPSAGVANLPPLSGIDLPPQTQNGITATLESYYADASRLVFQVRITGGKGVVIGINLNDEKGAFVNASTGSGPAGNADPSLSRIEFNTETPLPGNRFKGQLEFSITANPGDAEEVAEFRFPLDIPIHPALTFNPKQTVWANGLEILLDRLVITPASTQAYLCYLKPTAADWTIGQDATLRVNGQVANVQSYGLLFDSAYGDGTKGGELGWTPPVQEGRCVKIGFPIGATHPNSLVLTIPALEQSVPEVIPADALAGAYEILKAEGIDMEWHTVDHGAYPEYKKLPAGMTEEEAYRQFIRALGYIHPGGWTFELTLNSAETPQPRFTTSFDEKQITPIPLSQTESQITTVLPGHINSFDISPNSKAIAFATSKGIVLYDLASYKYLRTLNETENTVKVTWSPDGKKLAAGNLGIAPGEEHLAFWDTSIWKIVFEPKTTTNPAFLFGAVAWSPDSDLLAANDFERDLLVFDVETGAIVSQQKNFIVPAESISWSPDSARIAATGDLGYGIRRWRVDTDESVRLYDQRGDAAMQVAWSPDGKRIASGHQNGTVCFWTVSTNQCDGLIYAHEDMASSLAWSPDGSKLATGGDVIRIWDSQTGQLLNAFGLSDKSIYTKLAWPRPNQLVSLQISWLSDSPTIVRFWDLTTGKLLRKFEGQSGSFGE